MTPDQEALIQEAEALAAVNGTEGDLDTIRSMIVEGESLTTIEFMLNFRYDLALLEALQAQVRHQNDEDTR